jgi:gamma-glutamyl:cysteine ligase YbdK (ATP-grasp superfamily)
VRRQENERFRAMRAGLLGRIIIGRDKKYLNLLTDVLTIWLMGCVGSSANAEKCCNPQTAGYVAGQGLSGFLQSKSCVM